MNINETDKVKLIKYRLDEAKDTIEDVQLLITNEV